MPKTCLVIPVYNEAARFPGGEFCRFLDKTKNIRFLFVDDGSGDGSASLIKELAALHPDRISLVCHGVNRGKAEAIRTGMKHLLAEGHEDYVGYWDADLSTPLDEIEKFLNVFAAKPEVQMVAGCRVRRMGARVERRWYRHYLGRLFATVSSLILGLPFYDTQCGAKMFCCEIAARIFADPFASRWVFDVELAARIIGELGREKALAAIHEEPLDNWRDVKGSKLTVRHAARAFVDLMRIRKRYRLVV